jgi:regulator of replication initiation timing
LEEVVAKVMQVDKAVESFQTMAIMSLNMGNLNLEVSNLKNILTTKMKEKVILQMKLAKDKHF